MKIKADHIFFLLALTLFTLLWGCASMGTPSGGPRDEDPPRFISAKPAMGAVEVPVDLSRASLQFNEIVNVKDAFSKVMISPSGTSTPRVTASGRRISIEFEDSLLPNTTYTVDFADAIEDNNEANKMSGFFYTFSTGETLDSLEISGMVLGALDLEPQQQVLVGLYPASEPDSAFFTKPFERLALTDDRGRFTIPGLKPVPYRIYALKDNDADRHYANPEEDIAILPYTVTPSAERIEVTDTILDLKTGQTDTIVTRQRTRFLPNDVLLRMFNTGIRPKYLAKYQRPDSTRLTLLFNAPAKSLPVVDIPAFPGLAGELITEHSATNDTITYWLPRHLASVDSLEVSLNFLRPDSLGNLVEGTDLLDFDFKRPKPKADKKKKKEDESEPDPVPSVPSLNPTVISGQRKEIYSPLELEFPVPLARLDTAAFRLEMKQDTLWKAVERPHALMPADSLNPRRFSIDFPWEFNTTYRIVADSASAEGLYGQVMNRFESEFTTKDEEDYSTLILEIKGLLPQDHAFVELLNSGDNPIRRQNVVNGQVEFKYLDPGTYYLRLIEDFNGDSLFTTGNPETGTPPDQAFYYPQKIVVKKNWDIDQTWEVFQTPVDAQKPAQITKNKPKARKGEQTEQITGDDEEEPFDPTANPFDPKEEKRRQQRRQNNRGGMNYNNVYE